MQSNDLLLELNAARAARGAQRRHFMKMAGGATAAIAGASLLSACDNDDDGDVVVTPTPTPTPSPVATTTDQNILNFALNLEYLEAQFYAFAVTGQSIPGNLLSGTGAPGAPTGGRAVNFTDPTVRAFAREIAADEQAHVAFLRAQLGSVAVAQPAIDLSPAGAFSAAARAAGLIGAGQTFDPYASDENFLLAAFIFEDVGVTAYKGAAPLITSKTYLEAAAGILAAEAYHAGLIRTTLYRKGVATPALIDGTESISNARDSLDGTSGAGADRDQGVRPTGDVANIVPTDEFGIAFSRSTQQTLNIAFLTATSTDRGGFFPAGINGAFRTSGANA